jgi:hypothetical protein
MGSRCVYKMVEYPNRSQRSFAKLDDQKVLVMRIYEEKVIMQSYSRSEDSITG